MSLRAERMSLRIKLAGLRVDRARLLSDQRLAGGEIGGDREGIVVAHVAQHSERGAKRKSNPGKIPNGSFARVRGLTKRGGNACAARCPATHRPRASPVGWRRFAPSVRRPRRFRTCRIPAVGSTARTRRRRSAEFSADRGGG